jgi:diaminopimelate decarboxylase
MNVFQRLDGALHVESVAAADIVRSVGSPVYVYSREYLETRFREMQDALEGAAPSRICYAVKANSNLAILRLFSDLGAGFDIVSGGELQRVLHAGGDPAGIVFSGVGKSTEEMDLALKVGIGCFNVESPGELERLAGRAALLERPAKVAVRVNPDVDARTHPYISTGLKENKFGVPAGQAVDMLTGIAGDPWLEPAGIACHIGSQIEHPEPLLEALEHLLRLVDRIGDAGVALTHLDLGGGFGVSYSGGSDFDIADYGQRVQQALAGRGLALSVEPGRYLVANGGILLTTVEYTKMAAEGGGRSFAVVDAGMNDLIRPALYQAEHRVEVATPPADGAVETDWDVVGPVCESGDFLARDRRLSLAAGDVLAVHSAGAYCMVQSSNYNSRPRPAEVLVEGDTFRVIRRRETVEDLMRGEVV